MIVITGTQRSGTSIMARFFKEAGYNLPINLTWDESISGGYENAGVDRFFREYIGDNDFSYSDIDNMVDGEINPTIYPKGQVCKIAYLMQNPIFIYIWHKFRGNQDKFIIMDRDKEFVYKTKLRRWDRFQYDSLLLQQSEVELDIMFKKSLKIMDKLKMEYVICPFPDMYLDWQTFSGHINKLTSISGKKEVFDRIIDPSKIHYLDEMMERRG